MMIQLVTVINDLALCLEDILLCFSCAAISIVLCYVLDP